MTTQPQQQCSFDVQAVPDFRSIIIKNIKQFIGPVGSEYSTALKSLYLPYIEVRRAGGGVSPEVKVEPLPDSLYYPDDNTANRGTLDPAASLEIQVENYDVEYSITLFCNKNVPPGSVATKKITVKAPLTTPLIGGCVHRDENNSLNFEMSQIDKRSEKAIFLKMDKRVCANGTIRDEDLNDGKNLTLMADPINAEDSLANSSTVTFYYQQPVFQGRWRSTTTAGYLAALDVISAETADSNGAMGSNFLYYPGQAAGVGPQMSNLVESGGSNVASGTSFAPGDGTLGRYDSASAASNLQFYGEMSNLNLTGVSSNYFITNSTGTNGDVYKIEKLNIKDKDTLTVTMLTSCGTANAADTSISTTSTVVLHDGPVRPVLYLTSSNSSECIQADIYIPSKYKNLVRKVMVELETASDGVWTQVASKPYNPNAPAAGSTSVPDGVAATDVKYTMYIAAPLGESQTYRAVYSTTDGKSSVYSDEQIATNEYYSNIVLLDAEVVENDGTAANGFYNSADYHQINIDFNNDVSSFSGRAFQAGCLTLESNGGGGLNSSNWQFDILEQDGQMKSLTDWIRVDRSGSAKLKGYISTKKQSMEANRVLLNTKSWDEMVLNWTEKYNSSNQNYVAFDGFDNSSNGSNLALDPSASNVDVFGRYATSQSEDVCIDYSKLPNVQPNPIKDLRLVVFNGGIQAFWEPDMTVKASQNSNPNSRPSYYKVTVINQDTEQLMEQTCVPDHCLMQDLVNGDVHSVQVQACNVAGCSENSNVKFATPKESLIQATVTIKSQQLSITSGDSAINTDQSYKVCLKTQIEVSNIGDQINELILVQVQNDGTTPKTDDANGGVNSTNGRVRKVLKLTPAECAAGGFFSVSLTDLDTSDNYLTNEGQFSFLAYVRNNDPSNPSSLKNTSAQAVGLISDIRLPVAINASNLASERETGADQDFLMTNYDPKTDSTFVEGVVRGFGSMPTCSIAAIPDASSSYSEGTFIWEMTNVGKCDRNNTFEFNITIPYRISFSDNGGSQTSNDLSPDAILILSNQSSPRVRFQKANTGGLGW